MPAPDAPICTLLGPLGISLGDPSGIGPEIVVRALAARPDLPVLVFGDAGVLSRAAMACGVATPAAARIVAVTTLPARVARPGRPDHEGAVAQLHYLNAATDAVMGGRVRALVTAPISKEQAGRAGFPFPGHTEYLAGRAGTSEFAMMIAGPHLRVTVATTHLALREVPAHLGIDGLAATIVLTARALGRDFGAPRAAVAVAGLNPHAGEGGRFGDEESTLVVPAIARARARLDAESVPAQITGPHVPDVVFRQAVAGAFDAVVALYHDQGLIPVKLVDFDEAVNVTLGLPFVRTSPDHGTAYDIAGRGVASAESFLAALDLAAAMALRRGRSAPSVDDEVDQTGAGR